MAKPESLTPQEHLDKSDAALAAALKVRKEMDEREQEHGMTLGKSSDWYLSREHDFLTLMQIVSIHANMASAKSLVIMANKLTERHD